MTKKELMAILNDPHSNVVCFLSDKPHEVSREEFKAWLNRKDKPKAKRQRKTKGATNGNR